MTAERYTTYLVLQTYLVQNLANHHASTRKEKVLLVRNYNACCNAVL